VKTVSYCAYALVVIALLVVLVACNSKAESGKQVFQDQCGGCHNAGSRDKKVGPGLKGLFRRDKLPASGKKVSEANVRSQIEDGGNGMPSFDQLLSDNDKDSLLAYLKTL
jgi:cytochrome c